MAWLIGIAGFSEVVCKTIVSHFRSASGDRYKFYYVPMKPDLNQGGKYTAAYVDSFVRNILSLSFQGGEGRRGYCNHYDRACRRKTPGPHDCNKLESESCGRLKPEFICVLFADGLGTSVLVERVSRFAFYSEVARRNVSGQLAKDTLGSLINELEAKFEFLSSHISVHPRKVRSPLVLPPKNFVSNGVTFSEFLRKVRLDQSPKVPHDKYDALWQIRDREGVKGYRDRRRLDFKPAAVAAHGRAAIPASRADDVLFALGTFYRLGVPFHELLHFDIDRQNGAPINLPMWCEKIGAMTPKITGEHVNIYPNDRVGNDS